MSDGTTREKILIAGATHQKNKGCRNAVRPVSYKYNKTAKLSADILEYDNREQIPTCKAYYRGKTISYCSIISQWL